MSDPTSIGNPWVPIGLETQFPVSSAHPVIANGEPLVVWRGEATGFHVWEDRCPHRGMRLSFGFVRGDTLTCLYHGWRYGSEGGCQHIPAHPDLEPPETICTKIYASTTSHGLVFTAPAGTEAMAETADDRSWFAVRSIFLDLSEKAVRERVTSAPTGLADAAFTDAAGLLVAKVADGDEIALAIQPIEAEKTALHLSTTIADPEARMNLARRLLRLRQDLESLGGGT
ncbi:MAG: Rieske (2Fe-2S) protein [Pseudomonadota bacterium]